jgi:hypothetical protein
MRRRLLTGACALTTAALTAGCGFANALARPPTPSYTLPDATVTPSATPRPPSTVVADAELVRGSFDGRTDSLPVRITPVQRGVPIVLSPGGVLSIDCRLDAATTEYVTVSVRLTDHDPTGAAANLHVDFSTTGRSAGLIAVPGTDSVDYCHGTPTLPVRASLQTVDLSDDFQTMTVYIVARTSPDDPHPLRGVTLQLRHLTDEISGRYVSWRVQRITQGAACPGDADSLCLPVT